MRFHADEAPKRLSEWRLLRVEDGALVPNEGVIPYDLNTPLFSDYALKMRTVWMPAGAQAEYRAEGAVELPVGTVLSKTFYYRLASEAAGGEGGARGRSNRLRVERSADPGAALGDGRLSLAGVRLIETRLLVRRERGWIALPYVWDDTQRDAVLEIAGDSVELTLVSADDAATAVETSTAVEYVVPDVNQCAGCHVRDHGAGSLSPLGPTARHLNRWIETSQGSRNQLEEWAAVGLLRGLPSREVPKTPETWRPGAGDSLEARARAYLDVNCGHCHNPRGPADTSGLFLDHATTDLRRLGVCKPPVAAGRGSGDRLYSIVPGRPDRSILVHRMGSIDPGVAMPELGRGSVHTEGVELISDWIASLDGDCPEPEGLRLPAPPVAEP
ncbi:MAG TPA: SO2930 family diheme c-type cytochrome [Thermoanaerobaculia bacterium]|nr:SO2930 family diheme c-type cytochrome [Thermoanaerobaculia bacterium]